MILTALRSSGFVAEVVLAFLDIQSASNNQGNLACYRLPDKVVRGLSQQAIPFERGRQQEYLTKVANIKKGQPPAHATRKLEHERGIILTRWASTGTNSRGCPLQLPREYS